VLGLPYLTLPYLICMFLAQGISGFLLTVLLSNSNLRGETTWVYYLEIADVTLFFSALIHVGFSFALILSNVARIRSLRTQLAVDVHSLVDKISHHASRVGFLGGKRYSPQFSWNPFSDLRAQIELRILRIMFLKQFNLERAFDFARYLTLSEEHHILQMLKVSHVHWLAFLFFLGLNYLRNEVFKSTLVDGTADSYCNGYLDEDEKHVSILFEVCACM
jgi:hypothetical protein